MRRSTWSIQDAKKNFNAVVKAAEREPQTVIKHGSPTVVVIAAAEYTRLRHLQLARAGSFGHHLLAMPRGDDPLERLDVELRGAGV